MMKLGIVSDTHIHRKGQELPRALVKGLAGVDRILHAGDWIIPDVAAMLERIAPVDGVAGNNDGGEIIARFGRRKLLEWAGFKIGVVHGDGSWKSAEATAAQAFLHEAAPDLVIFGHSHIPYMGKSGNTLLFNPGSPTDKRRQPRYSYGIVELGETIVARHYYFDDKG